MNSSCQYPVTCTIQTEKDDSPEDDDMGPPSGQTMMDKLDNMDGIDLEVSGTLSNTDCVLPTEEYSQLLEEIRKTKTGKENGATINWPVFGESPISEYGEKRIFCIESRSVDINIKDWARQQLFLANGRLSKDKMWCLYALN
jgi:hypothetical protein